MNLLIFGPPGAGKGTQAQNLVKKYNLFQLSTGDLLRNEIKNKSQLGIKIAELIDKGNFVTDDIVNQLLKKIIINPQYKNKIIFDGYPRNISQAKNLDKLLNDNSQKISYIIFLNVDKKIIEKRITGRIICEKCNKTLNEYTNPTNVENHPCGKKFFKKRTDDDLDTLIKRYDIYMKETKPVLEYYSSKSNFNEVDGNLEIDQISAKIEDILNV